MSGGFFNYENYRLADIARQIEEVVLHNEENEYYQYNNETLLYMKVTVYMLEQADILCHRIDWLLSGDDGAETFEKLLEKQLSENIVKHKDTIKALFDSRPKTITLQDCLDNVSKKVS